jgi:hypothetical protein
VARARPVGRSHASSWDDRRQNDEGGLAHRSTNKRIDELRLPRALIMTVSGTLATGDDQAFRVPVPVRFYPETVRLDVKTAPAGSALHVDLRVDDVKESRPQAMLTNGSLVKIPDGDLWGSTGDVQIERIEAGSHILVDIDQVGSGTAGADLTISVWGYVGPDGVD